MPIKEEISSAEGAPSMSRTHSRAVCAPSSQVFLGVLALRRSKYMMSHLANGASVSTGKSSLASEPMGLRHSTIDLGLPESALACQPPNGSRLSCGRKARGRKAVERQIKRLGGEATQFLHACARPSASSAC